MSSLAKDTKATMIPAIRYRDAVAAIDWLCEAFGFERHLVVPGEGGAIAHAQLAFGNGMVMLGSARDDEFGQFQQPLAEPGGNPAPFCHSRRPLRHSHRPLRHSRESGNPGVVEGCYSGVSPLHPAWIPAFAGMTNSGAGWRFKESTMKRTLKTVAALVLCLALGGLVTANKARAADDAVSRHTALDGFYLRAGFVADSSKPTRFRDEDCSSTSPAALYGCGDGLDGAPISSLGDFGTKAGIDLGLGYVAAPALRLEAVVQHRPRFSFDGRANFLQTTGRQDVSAELSTLTGMLAAYVDLPALGLPRMGPLSPFIGAGAGLSRIRIGEMRMEFARTRTIVPGGRRTGFAWMATAGVAVSLGSKMALDLAWRYTDYGAVKTGKATGRIEYRDGRAPFPLSLARTRAALRRHGWGLSLRYAF